MNKFKEFWESLDPSQKRDFADRLGSTPESMAHVCKGRRRVSPKRAREIERITYGKITKADMRPDLWD